MISPTLEYSPDPLSDLTPTYTDISSDLIEAEWSSGKAQDLDEPQAGTATFRLKNTNRKYEPEYAAGTFYPPGPKPLQRFRLSVSNVDDMQGIEFWGDFEQGADGTAPEWTSGNGGIDCKAGAEARQLSYVVTPTPRLGARIARVEVASGDQFGASTGERCMLRRGNQFAAYPLATPEGTKPFYQFSFRPLAPWTHPTGWEIFQQFKSDARFGQPIFALETNAARTNFVVSMVTGNFPTAGDATAGTNSTTNRDLTGPTFAADVWWDVRYEVHWTTASDGYFIWYMKQSTSGTWVEYGRYSGQTLPTITGDATLPTLVEQNGFYRNASAFTNVVFHDGYQVGHSWTDVDYPTTAPSDPAWNTVTWDRKANILDLQGGNPGGSFENNTVGVTATGGGITVTSSTDRSKFGSYSLKVVTDGAGSSQGVRHFKSGGATRFDVTAGSTYTASCWVSSAADFSTWRIGIEFFDAGSVSLGTTQCLSRALRNDFRHFWVTAVAPVGAVTARIENRWGGTTAGTFYVDGLGFWEGTYGAVANQGIWYAQSWSVNYPDKAADYSEVTVNCVDGFGILSMDTLDFMDPPDAETYEDVVNFDQPSFYYRLGEPEGTKLVSHVRYRHGGKWKGENRRNRRYFTHRRKTRAEVEGVAGPPGTYKGTPTLGEPGAILGDTNTSVLFTAANNEYARIALDNDDLITRNRLTISVWTKVRAYNTTFSSIVSGGYNSGAGARGFNLYASSTGNVIAFSISDNSGLTTEASAAVSTGSWVHVAGTWDGATAKIYVNGVLIQQINDARTMTAGTDGFLYIAKTPGLSNFFDGWIDEVAIYEKALSADRILAHYNAGANRGFAQQLAGSRISAIATSDLWSEGSISAGSFQVVPRFENGQAKLEEIMDTVRAEIFANHFYFNGAGDPVYLGWNYADGLAIQGTLGDATGEIPYVDLNLVYDDEMFNEVTTSTETGVAQTVSDATSQTSYRRRAVAETGLLNVDDNDVHSIASAVLAQFKEPQFRLESVSPNGGDPLGRTAILQRQIGDRIRVKRRQGGGTAIDMVTVILGVSKSINCEEGLLRCTWNTARGFNAADGRWHAGVPGFSEAEVTTVAG